MIFFSFSIWDLRLDGRREDTALVSFYFYEIVLGLHTSMLTTPLYYETRNHLLDTSRHLDRRRAQGKQAGWIGMTRRWCGKFFYLVWSESHMWVTDECTGLETGRFV